LRPRLWIEVNTQLHTPAALHPEFGPKRMEVTGGQRKLHDKELSNLYSTPNINKINKSRRMRWAGHVELMRRRETHTNFIGKRQGKRPLGRPKRR
jgi:hypothetical protein